MADKATNQYNAEFQFSGIILAVSSCLGICVGLGFTLAPEIDLSAAGALYHNGGFILNGSDFWYYLRRALMIGYFTFYGLVVIGLATSWRGHRVIWGLEPRKWFYLAICSLVGPLLISNVWLKSFVGRPRPRAVEEFGGNLDFTPVFHWGGGCIDNCSFVSGEVSSAVMIFASLLFILAAWRKLLALGLVIFWGVSGYMRMGQGGHFASDVFYAGIFMLFTAAILYRIIILGKQRGTDLPLVPPLLWRLK